MFARHCVRLRDRFRATYQSRSGFENDRRRCMTAHQNLPHLLSFYSKGEFGASIYRREDVGFNAGTALSSFRLQTGTEQCVSGPRRSLHSGSTATGIYPLSAIALRLTPQWCPVSTLSITTIFPKAGAVLPPECGPFWHPTGAQNGAHSDTDLVPDFAPGPTPAICGLPLRQPRRHPQVVQPRGFVPNVARG